MNKTKLNQYRSLCREIPKIKRDIAKLEKRMEDVPVVAGKVTKSSNDFPYILEHVKVQMNEPKLATELKKQIRYKELRLDVAERTKTEIEEFVAGIEDSTHRQIFELYFIEKLKQEEVADTIGYSRGRISQIISSYLKD